MTEATLFLPGLSPVGRKTISPTFDGGKLSSNGGVLILREIERKLGLAAVLSRHIPDDRDRTRITHSYSDMTRARMFAIASGHEDCDDLDVLRSDPALKMACGRLPVSGSDLMSQPTLSRLENTPFWRQLARMGLELIDLFWARFERVPRCVVLDIDDPGRCCAWTAAACIVQHPCRRLLLPADPDLRGDDRPARAVAAAPRQAAIGRGSRANPASRHRSHPSQLARSRDHSARRQSLRDARSDGLAGREALQLHLRTVHQPALAVEWGAVERGCRHTPSAVKNEKDAALLPDQLCRSQLEQAPQGRRPRRGEHTLHRHQPARPGKSPLRKGLLRTRAHGESHQ